MTFNFDQEINRLGTSCVKWEIIATDDGFQYGDHAHPKYGNKRLLPLWVADMDFASPPAVIEALADRARHGLFGYTIPTDAYYEAVTHWFERRYHWQIERDWITLTPGVVPAVNMLVETFLSPGDRVIVQRPVYYPFFHAVTNNGGEIVSNSLVYENGRYHMDFADLVTKAADPATSMIILCSPHNPVARVWTQEELTQLGEICLENNVLVIADEIHCDLIYPGSTFTSFANIAPAFAQNSITCTAPSKTFNLAGLKTSNIIIPNPERRQQFARTLERHGLMGANAFGIVATEAAYNHGEEWLTAAMSYIAENYRFMAAYIAEHLPQLKVIPPEGTYLVWVDCSGLELEPAARKALFMQEAHVYLDEGSLFGVEGAAFERFNIACPRSILAEALERIKTAVVGR